MTRTRRRNRLMTTLLMAQVAWGDESPAEIKATIKGRHAKRRAMAAKFRASMKEA